jgi:hypothetical protein
MLFFSRLKTLRLLFLIILDVINPSFIVEDRQWQPSATIIFYNYFTTLWKDPQVFVFLNHDRSQSFTFRPGRIEGCRRYLVANTAPCSLRGHIQLLERNLA